jgi:hypothetical protein
MYVSQMFILFNKVTVSHTVHVRQPQWRYPCILCSYRVVCGLRHGAVHGCRVVISCNNTCPVLVTAYSQRTRHSTLLQPNWVVCD